jgi:hypothetical protein
VVKIEDMKMPPKEVDKGEQLSDEQLDNVAGGQGISVPVRLKNETTVAVPDNRSIAQKDSPFETDDNLPS